MVIEYTMVCVCVCVCMYVLNHCSRVRLSATSWTIACQAPLSMGIFQARITMYSLLCTSCFAEFFVYVFSINSHSHYLRSKES